MKLSNFLRRSLAMLVLLATVLSLLPVAFAAEEETGIPKELQGKDLVASYDENGNLVYTEADESVRGAMRASSFNEQATQDFSTKARVAFFIDNGNSENSSHLKFTISNANIDNLVNRGVTDFFVMTKTQAGSFSTTNLKNVISYAASSVKVYAWMHSAFDKAYIKSHNNSAQYHFSVGRKCNAYDTSHSLYDSRNSFVDLSQSAYKTYFNGLVDQVEACTGVDGILLDSVKWGGNYYGWDTDARTAMGKTAYNAAVTAMAKHEGYVTKTDSDGYKVWSSTNTANADYASLTTFCNGNSANAQKYMNYRSNVIKGFVDSVRSGLNSSLYLGVAIEPDWDNSLYTQSIFGQFPGNLKTTLKKGFCVAKTFLNVLQSYGSSYYGTSSAESLGSRTAKQIAKLGCNVFIGIDGYWTNNSSYEYIWYDPLYYQSYYIHKSRFDVNGDLSYGGDILGAAVYTAGNMGLQKITVSSITSTPDITVDFVNPNIASYGMLSYFHKYNDSDAQYNYAKGGTSAQSVTDYNGKSPMRYFCNNSTDGYNMPYIGAYASYTGASAAAFGTGKFVAPLKNVSVSYSNLPFARFGIYDSGNSGNSYSHYDIIPMYPHWVVGNHTSCTFTETVKVVGTCVTDGYSIMKCNTCGYSYIKTQLGSGHSYGDPVVTPATCTTAGSSVKTCTSCGNKETTTIAATGHTSVVDAAVAATCTSTGLTEGAHCSVCQAVLTAQQTVPMLPHTEVDTPYVAPTCTGTGATEGKQCSVCGTVLIASTVIAPIGHDTVVLPAVPATCTESGLTEGEQCLTCGEITVPQLIVDAFGHDYVTTVVPPTCISNGYTTFTCDICGDSYTDDDVPMSGHDYEAIVTPPTCTEDGYTTNTCIVCGESYVSDVIPAMDHDYITETVSPTCTEQGYTTYTCCVCGETFNSEYTPAAGHDYMVDYIEPTCTSEGYSLFYCECGDEYKDEFVPMIDHSYTYEVGEGGHYVYCEFCDYTDFEEHFIEDPADGTCILCGAVICEHSEVETVVDVPATCTEEGEQHTVCADCGQILGSETIEPTGHDVAYFPDKAATCEERGNRAYYQCLNCEVYFADADCEYELPESFIFTPAADHDYVDTTVDPTCDEEGYIQHVCSVCGATTESDYIAALGHDYTLAESAPTCTEPGMLKYSCMRCGDSYEEVNEAAPALGHDYIAVVTEPTCTENGFTTYTCSVCEDTYTDNVIEATGHDYAAVVTDPTCTEDGFTTYSCAGCGDSYTDNVVEANGHDFDAVVTEPTCSSEGYTTYTCSVCGAVEIGDKVLPLDHTFETVVTEPTCTENGYTTFTCTVCGAVEIGDEVEAEGHDHEGVVTEPTCTEDGYTTFTCNICGAVEIGDIIEANGHFFNLDVTEPTCTTEGFTTYTCWVCGAVEIGDKVLPLDHNFETVVTDPTCTEDGFTTYTCTACGHVETSDEVEALGHSYESVVTEATCTENGYTTFTCTTCNDSYTEAGEEAPGHDYEYIDIIETHIAHCLVCDYSEEENHNFVDGSCVCGAIGSNDPLPDPNLKFNMNIAIGAEMVVNYNFMASTVSKYTDFYLEVSKEVAGGDPIVTTYGISEDHNALGVMNHPATGAPLLYNASYTGINAKEMGDKFSTTLYAVAENGTVYCSETVVSSIKQFLLERFAEAKATDELKTMAIDMLKYGAAAQIHLNYDTENLVTNDLTEEHLAYATVDEAIANDGYTVTGEGANITANITVGSKVELSLSCIYRGATDPKAVTCVITDKDNKVLEQIATSNMAGVMFSAKYANVGAREMRKFINVTFYEGETAISKTIKWNVESFVAQTRANSKTTETELGMVNAMLIYGDSVAAYMDASGL